MSAAETTAWHALTADEAVERLKSSVVMRERETECDTMSVPVSTLAIGICGSTSAMA